MEYSLPEWVLFSKETPGERISCLASIARYPGKLSDAFDTIDLEQSLHWSGRLYGIPTILDYIIETQKYHVKPENVFPVTGGTTMGIFLGCSALLKPGDEVICENPGWPQIIRICNRMGIKMHWWHLRNENEWHPDFNELKGLMSPRVKMIYVNHPHNPTGAVLSEEEITELCNIASHFGTYIISDEIYRGLEWGNEALSPSIVNYYDRGFSVRSLTKTLGVTGIRFGWFATRNKELYDKCYEIAYDSVLCNNIMSERIGERLLEPTRYKKLLEKGKDIGKQNLKLLSEMIKRNDFLSMNSPEGGYACFLRYDTKEPSWEFSTRMLKRKPVGIEVTPGVCWGEDFEHHLRIGFGGKPDQFKAALEILEEGLKESKRLFR